MAAAGVATVGTADARLGGGSSFGSRGSRTFSMPSATPTAPRVAPIERSQSAAPYANSFGASRPGFFGGGAFGRGLVGGFLGAGLFGLLFGEGLFGGLGGGFSLIGLMLQLGLLYLAFRVVTGLFRRQPAFGGGPGLFGGAFAGGAAPLGPKVSAERHGVPITIGPEDYQVFEQRLVQSQLAYSGNNLSALRQLATAEMAGNFAGELAANERRGVENKISDVRLLRGDLAEAWREAGSDFATVAMRFALIDVTVDRASGRIVDGDPTRPQEATEAWTFVRPSGSGAPAWKLSAIQQA